MIRSRLSQSDLHELLENRGEEGRVSLASKVAKQITDESFSKKEQSIANEIVELMTRDAAVRVREALVENLCYSERIPRKAALDLAGDVESVAVPLLSASPIFSDQELVQLISDATRPKQLAIAGRSHVGEAVADALVEAGSKDVVSELVKNPGAELSEEAMNAVVDRFGGDGDVSGWLALRGDVSPAIAERLVVMVSDHLRERLIESGRVREADAVRLVDHSRETVTVDYAQSVERKAHIEELVSQLHRFGRLTPSVILRAVCSGQILFFESALANLAGLDHAKAWMLIHDKGDLGLRAIFKEAGLSESHFLPCRIAVDVFHDLSPTEGGEQPSPEAFKEKVLQRIVSDHKDFDTSELGVLLEILNDGTDLDEDLTIPTVADAIAG